jgi:hypothetical protein
MYDV